MNSMGPRYHTAVAATPPHRNRYPCGKCCVRRELSTPGEVSFPAKAALAVKLVGGLAGGRGPGSGTATTIEGSGRLNVGTRCRSPAVMDGTYCRGTRRILLFAFGLGRFRALTFEVERGSTQLHWPMAYVTTSTVPREHRFLLPPLSLLQNLSAQTKAFLNPLPNRVFAVVKVDLLFLRSPRHRGTRFKQCPLCSPTTRSPM